MPLLNPTLMLVLVAVVWVLIDLLLPGPWFVVLPVAVVIVNVGLWLHRDWRRRRAGRAMDPTRPYSREDT
jgi:membrane protein implicated in regulation of membrane protease activity